LALLYFDVFSRAIEFFIDLVLGKAGAIGLTGQIES